MFNSEKGSLFPEKRQYLEVRRRAPGLPLPLVDEKIFRSRRQSKVKNNPVADADERPVFGEIFLARSPFDKGKRPTISCLLIEIVLVHPHDAREDVRRVSRVKSPRGIH